MNCNTRDNTLTYDELVKGWTSFHSFIPEFMVGMNNKFFTFKNGELFEHHSDNVPRNTFYGVQYPSRVAVMMNDNPSEVKELQAVSLEGNDTWEALIKAFVSNSDDFIESSITRVEFVKKEGIWYAYARRNESQHFDSKSTYGIGTVSNVEPTGNLVSVTGFNSSLCVGDTIVRGQDLLAIGTVQAITPITNGVAIELNGVGDLANGEFILGMKDSRIEGGNLRGYTLRMDLENTEDDKVELFAVNAEVMKSFT